MRYRNALTSNIDPTELGREIGRLKRDNEILVSVIKNNADYKTRYNLVFGIEE